LRFSYSASVPRQNALLHSDAVHVTVSISNPADSNRRWEGLFLVDTGAIDCYIPGNRLREIGIEPRGRRTYELADGTHTASISASPRSNSWAKWSAPP